MKNAETTTRASNAIAANIAQKRSRQAALEKRLEEAGAELEALRTKQGRALADGTEGPKASEIQALAETRDGLRRALGVLADDLTQLEDESKATAIVEAEGHERECIDAAVKLLEELNTLIRSVASTQLIPRADQLLKTVKTARNAMNARDALGKPEGFIQNDRVARRIHDHHMKTFMLIDVLRAFVAGRSLPIATAPTSAPSTEGKSASLAMT
jgi:hypothetical protein